MPLNKMLQKWFGGYDQIAGDLWGGFAAMLVALPAAIAYGIAVYAVLGPQYVAYGSIAGIIGAIALGMIAPLLGGSPRLISAPCAPAAAVMGALAAEIIKTGNVSPANAVVVLMLVGFLAGMLELVYGALGGGRFIKYIPYPVVSGYLSGVGALIILSQFPKLLGLSKGISVMSGMLTPSHWQGPGILVGVITMAGVLVAPRLVRSVPAVILGLSAGLLAYFGISCVIPELRTLVNNKLVIGPLFQENSSFITMLKGQWSAFSYVRLSDIASLLMPAVTLSVLLSIDTLKTCVVMDTMTRSRHNANRELMGQGLANIVSAMFDFSQPKRLVIPCLSPTMLIQDLILRPLHRLIQGQENLYVSVAFQEAELIEIGLKVLSRGERRQEMAEYEIALPLLQNVSKQLQHMHGGEIDGLYTPHVEDQKPAPLEVRFDLGKQLVRRAEKQAALQFGNRDQVSVLLQHLFFFLKPVLLGRYLVSVNFAPDDRTPDLLPDEQQDGQPHPHTCGGNEVEVNRSDHDQCDHTEIEYGGPLSQKEDTAKIDHSPSDHHQNSGEGGDGEPCNEPGQHEKGDEHKDPFQETGKSRPSAAFNVHKGRPHCT